MHDSPRKDHFPHNDLTLAERRKWLRIKTVTRVGDNFPTVLQVYILPEDVERSARASIKELRRIIKWLLTFVDLSPQTWHGKTDLSIPPKLYGVPSSEQDESLFYIFNTLDSPSPQDSAFRGSDYAQHSMRHILDDTIPGINTRLHNYQKRSVALMLEREEVPSRAPDQRKPKYCDLEGNVFYLDVFDGIITHDPTLFQEPRGGILAETMGYGKTLACLALILATRGHYPRVPEGRIENKRPPCEETTGSLLSMAARSLVHHAVPWKADIHFGEQQGYYYDNVIAEITKYNREFAEPIFNPTTPNRKASKREAERTLRLCYSTLAVVPPNLISQWQSEIEKHLQPEALDVLVIGKLDDDIPSWQELMHYDLVLIAKNRLEKEYRDNDLNEGKRYIHEAKYRSPLTEIRWLRIICDEGHDFAGSSSTHAMAMLAKMSVERRWIISGTPSGSIYGVEVNLAAAETQSSPRKASLKKALEDRRLPDSVKQEIKDVEKLRAIIVHFLRVQPWANQRGSDHASWRKYLAPFDTVGNRRSAPGLRPLLQSLIVRHRIEELDLEVPLPELHNKTIYLEPSYYDKLSLNLFMLDLTVNAVTSERIDEDYMFHPKNKRALNLLISNLRQSAFNWVGFSADAIAETMRVGNKYLDSHIDTISDQDAVTLTEGFMNGERALDDSGWRAFSTLHEIGVFVERFPGSEEARLAWSLHGDSTTPLLLGTTQARAAQQYIRSNMDQQDPTSGLSSAGVRVMAESRKRAEEESQSAKEKAAKAADAQQKKTPASVIEEVALSRSSHAPAKLLNTTRKRRRSSSDLTPPSPSTDVLSVLHRTKIVGFSSAKLTYLCSQLLKHSPTSKSIVFYDSSFGNIAYWLAEALELLGIRHHIYASGIQSQLRSKYLREFISDEKCRVLIMDLKQASLGLHIAIANRVYIVSPIWSNAVEAQAIKRAHRIGQDKEVWVETLVLRGTVEERIWLRRKRMSEREQRVEGKGNWIDDEGVKHIIQTEGFLKFEEEVQEMDPNAEGPVASSSSSLPGFRTAKVKESAKVCRLDVPQELFFKKGHSSTTKSVPAKTMSVDKKGCEVPNSPDGEENSKKRRKIRFADEPEAETSSSPTGLSLVLPVRSE